MVWDMPKSLEAFDTSQDRKIENMPLVSGAAGFEGGLVAITGVPLQLRFLLLNLKLRGPIVLSNT